MDRYGECFQVLSSIQYKIARLRDDAANKCADFTHFLNTMGPSVRDCAKRNAAVTSGYWRAYKEVDSILSAAMDEERGKVAAPPSVPREEIEKLIQELDTVGTRMMNAGATQKSHGVFFCVQRLKTFLEQGRAETREDEEDDE